MSRLTVPTHPVDDRAIHLVAYGHAGPSSRCEVELTANLLCFQQAGAKDIAYVGGRHLVEEGHVFLMSRGRSLTTERLSRRGRHRAIALYFGDGLLEGFAATTTNSAELRRPPSASEAYSGLPTPRRRVVDFETDAFLDLAAASLGVLSELTRPDRDLLRFKLFEILAYLRTQHGELTFALLRPPDIESPAARVRSVVEDSRHLLMSLTEWAFLTQMSVSTFKRHFTALYSTTPYQWSLSRRLEVARYRIETLAHVPSRVYGEIGFDTEGGFARAFKRAYNITPGQLYRATHALSGDREA